MSVNISHVYKAFETLKVLDDFSIAFAEKGVHCLFGPSGCGKTTALNVLSGLLEPDGGTVTLSEGEKLAFVFQEERLLPWCTVYDNVAFVLKGLSHDERHRRITEALEVVQLEKFQGYYPQSLSGGMRQRVALARAFAYGGTTLVMDEPFKGLDRGLKLPLMELVKAYAETSGRQVIFITHDVEEALLIATDIYQLAGPPLRIEAHYKLAEAADRKRATKALKI